jgi:hypothetical protein
MGKTSAATGRPIPKLITSPIRKTSGQTKPAVPDSQSVSICANLWTTTQQLSQTANPRPSSLHLSITPSHPSPQSVSICAICGQTKPAVADSQSVSICANLWTNKTRCRRQPIRVNLCNLWTNKTRCRRQPIRANLCNLWQKTSRQTNLWTTTKSCRKTADLWQSSLSLSIVASRNRSIMLSCHLPITTSLYHPISPSEF